MADATIAQRVTLAAVSGGVTAPAGFTSAALHSGIKAVATKLDLLVLAAERPVSAAGIFTTNLAQAAPVLVSKEHLARTQGRARAVVVNSGCANACTGEDGMANARRMAADVAAGLGCAPEHVLVASTGVIGVGLPMPKVSEGIGRAVSALGRGKGS